MDLFWDLNRPWPHRHTWVGGLSVESFSPVGLLPEASSNFFFVLEKLERFFPPLQ